MFVDKMTDILDILYFGYSKVLNFRGEIKHAFFCSFLTADELNIVSLHYLVPNYSWCWTTEKNHSNPVKSKYAAHFFFNFSI